MSPRPTVEREQARSTVGPRKGHLLFEEGRETGASSPILVGGGSDAMLTALEVYPEAFQVLSAQEMSDRRLPPLSDLASYTRNEASYVLRVLSFPGLEEQSTVEIEGNSVED